MYDFRLFQHQDTVDIFHKSVILFKEFVTHIQVGNICPRKYISSRHFENNSGNNSKQVQLQLRNKLFVKRSSWMHMLLQEGPVFPDIQAFVS